MAKQSLRRYLTPLPSETARPTKIERARFRPKNPTDRGDIDFVCPGCQNVLLTEMSEAYSKVAPPIWCDTCKLWFTPSSTPHT